MVRPFDSVTQVFHVFSYVAMLFIVIRVLVNVYLFSVFHMYVLRYMPGDKLHCNVLVSGVGFLHVPKMPDIPGMEDFQV